MNILMINYEYPPLGGGGGVAAANLAGEFVRQGHAVDYVTTHFKGLAREEVIDGVRIFREPVWRRNDLSTASNASLLTYPLKAIKRGLKLAKGKKYEVINTHFVVPSGPAGYFLSRKLGIPNVLSIYGGDIYDPSKRLSPHRQPVLRGLVRWLLNQADRIIPESNDLSQRLVQIYEPTPLIQRIPLGFTPTAFSPASRGKLGLREDRLYAVAVSRLIPRKDYPVLLRAFASAGVEKLELLIIGNGPEEGRLKSLSGELGIQEKVHFLGHANEETKYRYLSMADFFALASLHEGYGIVFQEAMYCGLPIATTNVGGQTDFLKEGENALLTEPGNVRDFAESLSRLARNPDLRKKMKENNLRAIKEQMIGKVVEQYLEVFKILLTQKSPVHPVKI